MVDAVARFLTLTLISVLPMVVVVSAGRGRVSAQRLRARRADESLSLALSARTFAARFATSTGRAAPRRAARLANGSLASRWFATALVKRLATLKFRTRSTIDR